MPVRLEAAPDFFCPTAEMHNKKATSAVVLDLIGPLGRFTLK
jgi:hypothetical protein